MREGTVGTVVRGSGESLKGKEKGGGWWRKGQQEMDGMKNSEGDCLTRSYDIAFIKGRRSLDVHIPRSSRFHPPPPTSPPYTPLPLLMI